MSKKILTIQDISCYGQCSITVSLPILSSYGIETAILPSAILSTHTGGFQDFTVLDLTDEMPKIVEHWMKEHIQFDAIYTGYIGDVRQFDLILKCKEHLLKKDGLFIVDPAMADHGVLYKALNQNIVSGMKRICSVADYILPNITEACFLTDTVYQEEQNETYISTLVQKCYQLGSKNVILTGVMKNNLLGAVHYDGKHTCEVYQEKQSRSYHGTGDIFSSVVVANILNQVDMKQNLEDATKFIVDCISETISDESHGYGVKFESILNKRRIKA